MLINFADKVAEFKIVYYGPAAAGKTTSLLYLAKRLGVEVVDMPLAGDKDRTVFFEFAPLTQKFGNWSVKFNFWTLPGQLRFSRTRALVLRGAQGIVYVADSQYNAAEENLRMLVDLQDKLEEEGLVLEGLSSTQPKEGLMPIVLFYNKRDLGVNQIMPVKYMDTTGRTSFIVSRIAAKVVVLPLPVAPVMRTNPPGASVIALVTWHGCGRAQKAERSRTRALYAFRSIERHG